MHTGPYAGQGDRQWGGNPVSKKPLLDGNALGIALTALN